MIVAPFVKFDALRWLLDGLDGRASVGLLMRWEPTDFSEGVSDLEVWRIVNELGGETRAHRRLHAKAFVGSNDLLIGSANVTKAGLGEANSPNVELLARPNPRDGQTIRKAIDELWNHSTIIHQDDFDNCQRLLETYSRQRGRSDDPALNKLKQSWPVLKMADTATVLRGDEMDGGPARRYFLELLYRTIQPSLEELDLPIKPSKSTRSGAPNPDHTANSGYSLRFERPADRLEVKVRASNTSTNLWVSASLRGTDSGPDFDDLTQRTQRRLVDEMATGHPKKKDRPKRGQFAAWEWPDLGYESDPTAAAEAVVPATRIIAQSADRLTT